MLRRLTTRARPRRTFSEIELIAIASTSLVATSASPRGTRFSTKEPPFPKIPIFTFLFDGADFDRFNLFPSKAQTVIVAPTFITRSSVFAPRFFNSLTKERFSARSDIFEPGLAIPSKLLRWHYCHQNEKSRL